MARRTVELALRHQRIIRFLIVGGINTVFGYSVFALVYVTSHNHNAAVVISIVLGVIFNFFTTGRIVFGNNTLRTFGPFVGAYVVALTANLVLLNLLVTLGVPPLVGQALTLPVVVVVSYLINARIVFVEKAGVRKDVSD